MYMHVCVSHEPSFVVSARLYIVLEDIARDSISRELTRQLLRNSTIIRFTFTYTHV